jgi:hypothetical protein
MASMHPTSFPTVTMVAPAANDLPLVASVERARRPQRDRRPRGPAWSEPSRARTSA